MTNEQTIDIMAAIFGYGEGCWSRRDTCTQETRQGLRELITAALAAKDAEIERLKAQLAEPAKPAPGEWIEWKGGECPIADGAWYLARTRGDQMLSGMHATARGWSHSESAWDIVAYRVLP